MGMGGNRSYGLRQLEKAATMDMGIRAPLAGMGLLGYHIKVEFILGKACLNCFVIIGIIRSHLIW